MAPWTTSSSPTAERAGSHHARAPAGSCRAGRPTSGVEAVGLLVDGLQELPLGRPGRQSTSSWSRLVADALMEARGVRRSWDTARRMAVRSRSPWAAAAACAASVSSRSRSRAWPSWAAKAPRTRRSSLLERWPGVHQPGTTRELDPGEAGVGVSGESGRPATAPGSIGEPAVASMRQPSPSGTASTTPVRSNVVHSASTISAVASPPATRLPDARPAPPPRPWHAPCRPSAGP